MRLRATGKDEFQGPSGRIVFIRDTGGAITELSLRGSRVFDIRFKRQ